MNYSIKQSGQSRLGVFAVGFGIFLLLSGVILYFAHQYYQRNLEPVGGTETSQEFTIETGESPQAIAASLEDEGLIRAAWAFSWYLRTEGLRGNVQAGTYAISPQQSAQEIAEIITGESRISESITLPPERRLDQIRDILINAGFTPEEVDAGMDASLYQDHPALEDKPGGASLEGYLYPETFHIDDTTEVSDIIEASLDEMASRLTPEIREGIKSQGLTVHEGIILASIVEREVTSHDPDDRPKVAQVFLSRLEIDMKLESDATAPYGAALEGLNPSEHQRYSSPYNTYENEGLPPSPISNVSESSLQAVANPADTDYMYFVSGDPDEDGVSETHFSHTLEEHERLVEEHCTVLCR